jgi:hypothetical protein
MLNDAAVVLAANAVDAAITHLQLYSAATNAAGTTNAVGARVAVNGTVDADGDITWSNVAFSGLAANQAVHSVGYWSASSSGTFYGSTVLSGDATANAAGEYTVVSLAENTTAS